MLHYSRSKQNYHNYGLRALMSKHVELIGTHSALKSVFVTLPDIHILATTSCGRTGRQARLIKACKYKLLY